MIIEISDQDFRPAALTSTCNVKILVNDINDNDPQFDPETLFIEITEQTTLNQAREKHFVIVIFNFQEKCFRTAK